MLGLCALEFPPRYTPDSKPYAFKWGDWLQTGETIASATVVTLDGDIVVTDVDWNDTVVTFRMSGGSAVYQRIACTIVTTATPANTAQAQATIACYT